MPKVVVYVGARRAANVRCDARCCVHRADPVCWSVPLCAQENLRNPNAPALPQVRADARTFSYVLGFSALLLFTVGAGPSARVLRPAASLCRVAAGRLVCSLFH